MAMNIKIPYAVTVLARICDTSASRYSLGGVRIRCMEGGVGLSKATATDGRIMAQLEWQQWDHFVGGCDVIVPGDKLAWFSQDFFRKAKWLQLKPRHIIANGVVVPFLPLAHKWPDAEGFLYEGQQKEVPHRDHCVDPLLLKKLISLACACTGDEPNLDISIGGRDEVIQFKQAGENVLFRGVINPRFWGDTHPEEQRKVAAHAYVS